MIALYIPGPEDGWFYVQMLSDPATMAYNAPWFPPDGCVPFSEADWPAFREKWIGREPERFYAFLRRSSDGAFVGDVNFHYVPERDWWDMGVLIFAPERGRGYGTQGLRLLLDRAFRVAGITKLHNEFETTRDAAFHIHKAAGFRELGIAEGIVHLELTREEYVPCGPNHPAARQIVPVTEAKPEGSEAIRWIFFDLGSTLIDETEADARRIEEMTAGTGVTPEAYRQKRLECIRQGLSGDPAAIAFFGLTKTPWHSELERPCPDAAPVLAELKRRGWRLGVIANQNPGTEARLAGWNLLRYFDVVAPSAELGVAKPDPAIFQWALDRAGCAPAEAVMVGDRLDNDIAAAKALGFHTVRVLRGLGVHHSPRSPAEEPEYTIRELAELPELFPAPVTL